MKAAIRIGHAFRRICSHPEGTGFMVGRAEAITIVLHHGHRLPVGEKVCHLAHRGIHYRPEITITLSRSKRYEATPDAVFVGASVEIHPAGMTRQIIEVRCGDFSDTSY